MRIYRQRISPETIFHNNSQFNQHCEFNSLKPLRPMTNSDGNYQIDEVNPNQEREIRLRFLPQYQEIKFILYPDDPERILWDLVIILQVLFRLMLYTIIVTPFRIAFIQQDSLEWMVVGLIVDCLFMLDVLINCISAYYNSKDILIVSRKTIFIHYLTTWMFLDIFASIPFQLIVDQNTDWSDMVRLGRLPRLYRMIKFAKLVRMIKMYKNRSKVLSCLQCLSGISVGGERLIYFLFSFLILCHLISCILCITVNLNEDQPENWVTKQNMQDQDIWDIYLAALYWTITTLTTVGYGDITPANTQEKFVCVVIMLIGVLSYSYTISIVTSLMAYSDWRKEKLHRRIGALQSISKKFNINKTFFKKLKDALEYDEYTVKQEREKLLRFFPKTLRWKLNLVLNKKFIEKNQFFQQKPLRFTTMALKYLRPFRVKPKEFIFRKGDYIEQMYFINTGEIGLYTTIGRGKFFIFQVLYQDQYFGDTSLFLDYHQDISAKSLKSSELLALSRKDLLQKIMNAFPQVKQEILEKIQQRSIIYENKKQVSYEKNILNQKFIEGLANLTPPQSRKRLITPARIMLNKPPKNSDIKQLKKQIQQLKRSIQEMECGLLV